MHSCCLVPHPGYDKGGFTKYDQQDLPGPISFIVVVISSVDSGIVKCFQGRTNQVDVVRVDSSRVKES